MIKHKVTYLTAMIAGAVALAFLVGQLVGTTGATQTPVAVESPVQKPGIIRTPIVRESLKGAKNINLDRPSIMIPAIGVDDQINPSSDLDSGPAFWPVTGRPGAGDTVAIAGHRTTFSAPFYDLHKLEKGDLIHLSWEGQEYTYEVQGRRILSAKNLHIADARGYEVLLLSACAKADGTPTSLSHRIVIYANPV